MEDTTYHVIKIKCSKEKNICYDIYKHKDKFIVVDDENKEHILFNINTKDEKNKKIYEYLIC